MIPAMKHSFMQEADKYIKSRQRKRQWYRVVTCLAAVVVFCTVYALILPAITMEQEGQCEIPEHTHDISCYMQVTSIPRRVLTCSKEMLNIHEHTDACYNEKGEPVCGYADFVVHVHDASCYDENGNLWCPLPQIRTHTHNERCFPADTAGTAAEHVHTEECFILTRGALICTETGGGGHTHGDSCYTETASLVCAIPESDAHQHGEGCYATVRELTCTLPETQGHEHTDSCYAWEKTLTCGQAAEPADGETPAEPKPICGGKEIILHKHTEECFDHGTLICGKTQVLEHVHNADCFTTIEEPVDTETLTCELPESEEHRHSALCYGTWILLCTQEEHTHSPICYADPTADLETAEVWEKTIANARLTGEWRQDVLAIAQTQLGYTESRKNFIIDEEDGTKQKGYTRYGAWYGSPYSDWCAIYVSFCLHYAGVPEEKFPMSSGCESWIETLSQEPYNLYHPARFVNADGSEESYVPTVGDLIFFSYDQNGISDHVGIVAELIPATESMPAQIKTIEGNTSNRVRYETYELESPVILGYGLLPEQSFFCGMQGHAHGPECEDSEGQIICGLAEHIHTEACEVPQEEPTTLQFIGPDYTVEVRYGAAALPEGVALLVAEIPADSEEYQHYYEQSVAAMEVAESEETVIFARFFDIQFQLDGQEIEPAAPVSVTITYAEQVETGEDVNCQAIHFTEEGPELLTVETANPDEDTTSFTHTQNGFSVVGDMVTASKTYNPTDVGPNVLPVDYYVCIDGVWTCVGSTKTGWYGDYSKPGEWTDYNRDYITVAQVESILGEYGFNASDENPAHRIAYQMKNKNDNVLIYSDTNTVEIGGQRVIPLSRDAAHKGFNVYYLPRNTGVLKDKTITDLPTAENAFYTVSVYDPNHIAYAAGEALPETQLVMAGNSVAVTVNAMPENSGAVWQCVNTSWSKVADGTANNDSTVTFNLTSITQQLRITPMATNLGDAIQRKVYYLVFLDGAWTEVGTTTPYYKNENLLKDANSSNYRHFVTSSQAESVLAPFGFRSKTYSSTVNGTSVLAHQLGEYDFNKSFYTDGGGEKLSDDSWAIGLGYITNVNIDYSFYYLPTNPEKFQGNLPSAYNSTNADMNGNRFWSVTVRDDGKYVYGNAELEAMKQYAADNGEATVTVQNANGVLWSCRGVNGQPVEVESTQAEGYTTFVIKNIIQPVEVVATRTNPSFTVQYYANIDRYVLSDSGNLEVINTSGKKLPTNSGNQSLLRLTLEGIGKSTDQNQGNATSLYRVKSEKRLTQMYTDGTYNFEEHPGLEYFDKLWEQSNYKLDAVLVLKEGKSADSTNDDDWWWYKINQSTWANITFTNIASEENAPRQEGVQQPADGNYCILLQEGTVLRLRYETNSQSYTNRANFHDYDITSGQNDNGTWRSGITGINKSDNYVTSGDGKNKFNGTHNAGAAENVFAFGNANCETGLGLAQWGGNNINAYNGTDVLISSGLTVHLGNNVYKGCTFGLVKGLDSNGNLIWANEITAPHLYNDGTANGKHSYNNGSLQFTQTGDMYTLTAANSTVGTRNDLEYFFNPSPSASTTHTHIFTNNYWPMDSATNKTDPLMGAINSSGTCDVKVNGFWDEQNTVGLSHDGVRVPISDDGRAHNWFFGMNFSLSFTLTEDYLGPLEYIFFGDDDMWVFLDNKLICDIGGVHSSVGEYVNLRDYLPNGSSGQHTLSFFYTERGASGSTCWMSFTLPSVSSATTGRDTGSLQIAKSIADTSGADFSGEEYQFKVELLTSENGSPLNQTFSYSSNKGTFGTIKSGGTIKLKADESITISGIPAGTYYRVTELSTKGYHVTVNNEAGYIVSGTIATGETKPAAFVNTPYYELPSTGGAGTGPYITGGLLLTAAASVLLLYNHIKRRKEDTAFS